MTIGFIGLGNMAKAMIGGIIGKKICAPQDIIGSARTQETRKFLSQEYGIRTGGDNAEIAAKADILFLAVKPGMFPEIIEQIREVVTGDQLIVSIAAGKTMDYIEQLFGKKIKLVRCMPNLPALVGEGCTALCRNKSVTEEEMQRCVELLSSFGMAQEVPESLMDTVVGVSGSSPAYVFLFIEAMADEAVAAGMPRQQAYQFAAQSVLGSAKLLLETGEHPGILKDKVCSPGGTTIQAVKVLEKCGFRSAVMEAMDACIEKSKML